jgi:hypothetical protein
MNQFGKKSCFAILFIAAFTFFACNEEDEFVSGTYAGTQVFGIGQVSSSMTIDLRQSGNSISGSVTPPFQEELKSIQNGKRDGDMIQFDRKEANITYRYSGSINRNGMHQVITGGFGPLGCIDSTSGEPCQTDSSGSFTVTKQ